MSTASEYGGMDGMGSLTATPAGPSVVLPPPRPAPVGVAPIVTPAGPSVVLPSGLPGPDSIGPAFGRAVSAASVNASGAVSSAPAIPYQTALPPPQEIAFQQWVAKNKIPFDPSPAADYDMRGYWKAMQLGDPRAQQASNKHFPDTWKTPYHATFSNESIYAGPLTPHWKGDKLVDWRGNVLADEGAKLADMPNVSGESTRSNRGSD